MGPFFLFSNSEACTAASSSRMVVLSDGLANAKIVLLLALVKQKFVLLALSLRRLWTYAIFVTVLQILVFLFWILINLLLSTMTMMLALSDHTT
jgi:hypothetical protein